MSIQKTKSTIKTKKLLSIQVTKLQKTAGLLANTLVLQTQRLMKRVKNETELRIEFEKILDPIWKTLGVENHPTYDRTNLKGKRPDAVYGGLIIEYKYPKSFKSKHKLEEALQQLKADLIEKSQELDEKKLVGVGFDGEKIFFVKYRGNSHHSSPEENFIISETYAFDSQTATSFLIYLRGLSRIPLSAENLAEKFGPESDLAHKAISALVNSKEYWGDPIRVNTFYNEWKRLFGIVYGEDFNGTQNSGNNILASTYKVGNKISFQELLFSVHTYFAFLMKLIAAELISFKETPYETSLSSELTSVPEKDLIRLLTDIEDGGIYSRKGITNFLEGDFFRWYIDAWSPQLKEAIQEITRTLSEFEPATNLLEPTTTRDLLKKLYQYLVPTQVRHALGEYYTPDWLAEIVLNEVNYEGNNSQRVLDPACGSGTFLVLAMQRAKEYGLKHGMSATDITKNIQKNIWGFDLNPLAVIAARTNYLFTLGDLANQTTKLEIPIYLTDSVLTPGTIKLDTTYQSLEIGTSVGKFHIPHEWIKNEGELLNQALTTVEEMTKNRYSVDEAMERLMNEGLASSTDKNIIENLYTQILQLEKENRNRIWARFLRNAVSSLVCGKFDLIIGNPPWIRWDYLAKEYREATRIFWENYGLFSLKGYSQLLGGAKPDFSMLFVYAASDYYLKDNGKLGFLITQEVFKSKGAGEGFRRFQLGSGKYLEVLQALDFASFQPFEGATNKTAAIILKKGGETVYPVPYYLWKKKKGTGKIASDKTLNEVGDSIYKLNLIARPIDNKVGAWQTVEKSKEFLFNIKGNNYYKARAGAWTDPYGIFWLKICSRLNQNNLITKNLIARGKKDSLIPEVETKIESGLIYPGITGRDIKRWGFEQHIFVLLTNDREDPMKGLPESEMKNKYPLTYNYLFQFKEILLKRTSYKKFHSKPDTPFYSQYNIGDYTFSRFKVIWKRMTNDIVSTVISGIQTEYGYKLLVPLDTTGMIPTDNETEAHYICAIINSTLVRELIKSFSSPGRGFGSPSVMKYVPIPKFNLKDKMHIELANISKECHIAKSQNQDKKIPLLENRINEIIGLLFKSAEN